MMQIDTMMEVIDTLNSGGTILYPTDTIWGIGCDACNARAIDKVYALKQRDPAKPFIVLAASLAMVKQYVNQVHPRIDTLLGYHKRPLTVVYEQARNLPPNLIAADGSVAIRIPQDDYCRSLIQAYGKPLVATSANISNEPFPKHFGAISSSVIEGVDHVMRGKRDVIESEPSVIVRLSPKGELIFLRS